MNQLEAALKYAARGWHVVALIANDKVPCHSSTSYHHASADPATIQSWWARFPKANVGIQPAKSGMVVLDVDQKNGGLETLAKLEKEHGTLFTLQARTPTGGYHFFFSAPAGVFKNKLGFMPGLDLIADKNHVVAAPSTRIIEGESRQYEWVNEMEAVPCPEWLADLVLPKPAPAAPSVQLPVAQGVLGRLALKTERFLKEGAPQGQWNNALFKAAIDAHEQNYSMEWFIERATKITGHLDANDMTTIEGAFSRPAKYQPRVDPNEANRQLIKRCHLIRSMADPDTTRLVDLGTGETFNVHPDTIKAVLAADDFRDYVRTNILFADFVYNPRLESILTVQPETGIYQLNTYIPAKWREAAYYKGEPIELCSKLPDVYDRFFTHLTGGDEPSKIFLLDWLAHSLRARNFTILCAIGEQGVGKGVLAEIMKYLHGEWNFTEARDQVFKSQFNGQLGDKTLVFVDEIALRTKEAHDRMKAVVNDYIEIERKGMDARTVKNWASFYLSSNSMDAIHLEPGDRRYSIIQLTDTKLIQTPSYADLDALRDQRNISELGRYLLGRKVTSNLMSPFRSARYEEVREAGLADWELYVIDEWVPGHRGQRIALSVMQDDVRVATGLRVAPGRRKFEELARKYPGLFSVIREDKGSAERVVNIRG